MLYFGTKTSLQTWQVLGKLGNLISKTLSQLFLYAIKSPLCQCLANLYAMQVFNLEPCRISHQEDDQSSCNLDSLANLVLPRAAGDVGACWELVRCAARKLCSIYMSHWGDVKVEMIWNTEDMDLMSQMHCFHLFSAPSLKYKMSPSFTANVQHAWLHIGIWISQSDERCPHLNPTWHHRLPSLVLFHYWEVDCVTM